MSGSKKGFSGLNVDGIGLPEILQLLEMSTRSMTLIITNNLETEGRLYIRNGSTVHAVTPQHEGREALIEIMQWEEGRITTDSLPDDAPVSYSGRVMPLLLEAMRRKDEANRRPETLDVVDFNDDSDIRLRVDTHDESRNGHTDERAPVMQYSSDDTKGTPMNIKAVQETLNEMREDLGDGLLGTDVWKKDTGLSVASINPQPKATALFNRLQDSLIRSLASSESLFSDKVELNIVSVHGGMYIYIIEINDDFRWGMLVDGKKVQLGLMLGVSLPSALDRLRKALV